MKLAALLFALVQLSASAYPGAGIERTDLGDTFTALPDNRWQPGLRRMPTAMESTPDGLILRTEEPESDPYPRAEDMVMTYPLPLPVTDKPSVVFYVYVPDEGTFPRGAVDDGSHHYFGARVTVRLPNGALLWPGLMLARNAAGERCLLARESSDTLLTIPLTTGWWTLGMDWNGGVTRYFARAGLCGLIESDLQLTGLNPVATVEGNFFALRIESAQLTGLTTPWLVRGIRVFTNPPRSRSVHPESLK